MNSYTILPVKAQSFKNFSTFKLLSFGGRIQTHLNLNIHMKKILFGLFLGAASFSFAGGFQLNVQSVRGLGLGGAYAGLRGGPASVFFNPGGMGTMSGHNFNAGCSLIFPLVSLQTPSTDNINQTSGMANPIHFYYAGEIIEDKLYVGLSINNQFGSSSSFEDSWEGRYVVQNIGLKTFTYQPTVAYKLNDYLKVGAGFMLTTGAFTYEKAVPVSSNSSEYGKASLSGSGIAYGYNVGIHSTPFQNDKMRLDIGLDYRSGQSIDLPDGTAEFTDIPTSLQSTFPPSTGFSSSLNLPYVATAGLAFDYNINEEHTLTLVYDFVYTGWSSYDTLAFDFENEDTPDSKTTKDWEDAPTYRFGLEYSFKDMIYVRGGGYYDVTPIKDGYVSPELPDATQFVPTFGFGVKLPNNIAFDFAWIHQDAQRESSLDDAGFTAKYHRIADVFSFSLSYNF